VTSPWDAGRDNEAAYAAGVALAARRRGASRPWYFLHCAEDLDVLPRVTVQADGTPVASILAGTAIDPGWNTQYGRPAAVDALLDPDGAGRLGDLVRAGLPAVFFTHWQALYGNGSYGGLHALDLLGERLRQTFGERIDWVPLCRHAELAIACQALEIFPAAPEGEGRRAALRIHTPWPCPRADLRLRPLTELGRQWCSAPLRWDGVPLAPRVEGDVVCVQVPLADGLLEAG
jgi:hypothetical protein